MLRNILLKRPPRAQALRLFNSATTPAIRPIRPFPRDTITVQGKPYINVLDQNVCDRYNINLGSSVMWGLVGDDRRAYFLAGDNAKVSTLGVDNPVWQYALGGKVEEGDTLESTRSRELHEETFRHPFFNNILPKDHSIFPKHMAGEYSVEAYERNPKRFADELRVIIDPRRTYTKTEREELLSEINERAQQLRSVPHLQSVIQYQPKGDDEAEVPAVVIEALGCILKRCPFLTAAEQNTIATAITGGENSALLASTACEIVRQYTENNQFTFFPYEEACKTVPQVERGFFKSKKSPFIEILKTEKSTEFCSSKDELEQYVEFVTSSAARKS